MGRKRRDSTKRAKKVTVALLERNHAGRVTEPYRIMDALVLLHHSHLKDAKLAIAWRFGWKADADGYLRLGQCKKGSDLDREMHGYDFVILLNHEAWNDGGFSTEQREALLDHQLCHAAIAVDSNGEPKKDEKGRTVYRIRKHDVEEFQDVVARHGTWTHTLERFAAATLDSKKRPLIQEAEPDLKLAGA